MSCRRRLPFTLAILPGQRVRGTLDVLSIEAATDKVLVSYDWIIVAGGIRKRGTALITTSELHEWTGWRP